MLTWIITHSDTLCNFLIPLLANFSLEQQRHALNVIEALIVCPAKHKTLAALTRGLRCQHADHFALADFFRQSPGEADTLRQKLTLFLLKTVASLQQRTGGRRLFLSVDDALCPKDAATDALQALTYHSDHVRSCRQKGHYTNAFRYLTLPLQLGPIPSTLTGRLSLKRDQVQRLHRERQPQGLPLFTDRPLPRLVEEMLNEIAAPLPSGCRVYVLFDAWHDSWQLEKFIRAKGWHFICATRSHRKVSSRPLSQWWTPLGHQRIEKVKGRTSSRRHTSLTRHVVGGLRRYPEEGGAILSKRERRDAHPAYLLCSDVSLSVRCILKYYGYRWQTEVDNGYLKERFGLADYRLHSLDAIMRWHTLVCCVYAFLPYQRVQPWLEEPQAEVAPLLEVWGAHQRWHAEQTVKPIASLVRSGTSDAELIAALLLT